MVAEKGVRASVRTLSITGGGPTGAAELGVVVVAVVVSVGAAEYGTALPGTERKVSARGALNPTAGEPSSDELPRSASASAATPERGRRPGADEGPERVSPLGITRRPPGGAKASPTPQAAAGLAFAPPGGRRVIPKGLRAAPNRIRGVLPGSQSWCRQRRQAGAIGRRAGAHH